MSEHKFSVAGYKLYRVKLAFTFRWLQIDQTRLDGGRVFICMLACHKSTHIQTCYNYLRNPL